MAGMEGFTRLPTTDKYQVASPKDTSLYQIIRYKGIFDLNELYKIVHDWLTSRSYEVHEHKYKSISLQTGGKERSFDWQAYRKETEFVMYWINLHFQIQDVMPVEVIKDGKKVQLAKGLLLIRIEHSLEYDWSERFTKSPSHQSIVKFLTTIMWKKKIDTLWEDKLRFKCYELANVIKESLDFMTKGNEHYDVW